MPPHATLRCEHVLCGRCPKRHGPYWYAYWRDGSRLRKRYLGKRLPRRVRKVVARWDRSWVTPHVRRALFSRLARDGRGRRIRDG